MHSTAVLYCTAHCTSLHSCTCSRPPSRLSPPERERTLPVTQHPNANTQALLCSAAASSRRLGPQCTLTRSTPHAREWAAALPAAAPLCAFQRGRCRARLSLPLPLPSASVGAPPWLQQHCRSPHPRRPLAGVAPPPAPAGLHTGHHHRHPPSAEATGSRGGGDVARRLLPSPRSSGATRTTATARARPLPAPLRSRSSTCPSPSCLRELRSRLTCSLRAPRASSRAASTAPSRPTPTSACVVYMRACMLKMHACLSRAFAYLAHDLPLG